MKWQTTLLTMDTCKIPYLTVSQETAGRILMTTKSEGGSMRLLYALEQQTDNNRLLSLDRLPGQF